MYIHREDRAVKMIYFNIIGLIVIPLYFDHVSTSKSKLKQNIRFNSPQNCDVHLHPVLYFSEITLEEPKANTYFVNGKLVVTKKSTGDGYAVLNLQRCDSNMLNCEDHHTIKLPSICQILQIQSFNFPLLQRTFEPPVKCPVKPGSYVMKNRTVGLNEFAFLPFEAGRWKASLRIYSYNKTSNEKLWLCLEGSVTITYNKRKTYG